MMMLGLPYNSPKSMYIFIYLMWFSIFRCSHPDPGEVDDGIDNRSRNHNFAGERCGRCGESSGDMEMGMVEKHYCYYLRCLK